MRLRPYGFRWLGHGWACRWWDFRRKYLAWRTYMHVQALSKGVMRDFFSGVDTRIEAWKQGMGRQQ